MSVGTLIIVTLQPELVGPLTMTGAFDEIAHMRPERTIVVIANAGRIAGDFPGHISTVRLIGALVRQEAESGSAAAVAAPIYRA